MGLSYLDGNEIERISNIFGDTNNGFTGREIEHLLNICKIPDMLPGGTKRIRLYNSFCEKCNQDKSTNCVYQFIKEALAVPRWLDSPKGRENMCEKINEVLALKGIQLNDRNEFTKTEVAETVSEAKRRAARLNRGLYNIHAHHYVMKCCREELLVNDYFHAVQEAAKSLTDRISEETGINLDGTKLIEKAFSMDKPAVVLNTLQTDSEKNEHRGLKEMLLGINFQVRNVTAHEMRMKWIISEEEAINILTIISALHRQLDTCFFIKQ